MAYTINGGTEQHCERRAKRYDIAQPVRFRTADGTWVEGMTVNMSAAGVLIRTCHALPPATPLVFRIGLMGDPGAGSHIGCSGHVLRSVPIEGTTDVLMAATIDNFQLRRASGADEDA